MKFSTLLAHRTRLVRQARLANLAFAYHMLDDFAARIARASLCGRVNLQSPEPGLERYHATLTALDGAQSVIEEHFTDEELDDLADVMAFIIGHSPLDLTFHIEDFGEHIVAPIRAELEQSGVGIDRRAPRVEEESNQS
jgi:hypothetical protein